MTTLEKKLNASLKRLEIPNGASILVAVSGGADSTALLDALVRRRSRTSGFAEIFVAHFNHQLRGKESDEDELFVKALAERLKLRCFAGRTETAAQARLEKKNLEATARRLRYEFLLRVALECGASAIFTAHTRDDQVETILMRLLRGSGGVGLRGIHEVRELGGDIILARPLLSITRAEVLAHCERHELDYRTDSSNFSIDFMRNRVRRELLPLLKTFNPKIDEALSRTAALISNDEEYLQHLSTGLLESCTLASGLQIKSLISAHSALRRRVLRLWLKRELGSLLKVDASHLAVLEDLILHRQSGRRIELPGGRQVIREFDRLMIKPPQSSALTKSQPITLTDKCKNIVEIDYGNFKLVLHRHVSRESANEWVRIITNRQDLVETCIILRESDALNHLAVRTRAPGDRYRPVGSRRRVKLKTLMIRGKIAISQREDYPVLVTQDDQIVWVPGLPAAEGYALQKDADSKECALLVARRIDAQETS